MGWNYTKVCMKAPKCFDLKFPTCLVLIDFFFTFILCTSSFLTHGKWKVKVKITQSSPTLCNPMDWLYSPWNSPGQKTGVGSLSLFKVIFLTQESYQGLLHWRRILYQLTYQGRSYTWMCMCIVLNFLLAYLSPSSDFSNVRMI